MLRHGGNLRQAAERYGIPLDEWLDLSTGINPLGWPVPVLPAAIWCRLPQENDGLEEAARQYYQATHVLPVAGSQAAIQTLPLLRPCGNIGMLPLAYAEHEYNWSRYGHSVFYVSPREIDARLAELDVLLLVNPNNPTGETFSRAQLLDWHRRLDERGGWLVVDEAFMDTTPQDSLAGYAGRPGLIVLRSLGKFFGLAGARCGFVLAGAGLLERLRDLLGPWTVSAPAREVARQALKDVAWQTMARQRLIGQGERLKQLLSCYSLRPEGGTSLFQWLPHPFARSIHETLAQHGIWTRYFDHPSSLRFGLPATERQWRRMEERLQQVMNGLIQRDDSNEKVEF